MCLFSRVCFWTWLCFASAGLPGSGWVPGGTCCCSAWGGVVRAHQPGLFCPSACPRPPGQTRGWLRPPLLTLGFAHVSQAWVDPVAGWVTLWPSRGSRCFHACASGPGWGLCRDRGVTVGTRGTTAKPPPVVFLLNVSGQHSRALAAAQLCPFRLPLSLSMGSPGPLILHRLCAAERCSPGRVRWLRGPPGAPLRLPKGLGVSMVPDKGYSL